MYDYDQEGNKKSGSLVVALLGRLVVVLVLVLILLLLFPTKKSLNPLYQSLFRDNLNSMKEAAETYYTNERLPEKLEDSKKMTLREMLNQNLIIPFVDKNNKECNLDSSYVEITKKAAEYELKVKLVCSEDEAYIIEHLGCTDKCANGACGTPVIAKQTEYQFKKDQLQNQLTGYNCPSDYTLEGNTCYKNVKSTKTIVATPQYEETTDTIDKKCETDKTYSCDEGWTLKGTTCTKDATYSEKSNTTYTCSEGTLSGSTCKKSATDTKISNTTYSCTNGKLSGTRCYLGSTSTGYNYSTRTSTSPAVNGNETILNTYTQKACDTCTTIRYYTIRTANPYSYCSSGTKDGNGCYTQATATTSTKTTYDCPSGWSLDGTTCTISATSNVTKTPQYTCSEGTLNDKVCSKDATEKENQVCSCSAEYTEKDGKCTKKGENKLVGYICPAGYDKINTSKCVKDIVNKVTENASAQYKQVSTTIYRWATTSTLSGWTATGKTREV